MRVGRGGEVKVCCSVECLHLRGCLASGRVVKISMDGLRAEGAFSGWCAAFWSEDTVIGLG